ncbi:retrotransposon protein, putative, ty3-gypsy subclass [Tanacetum coccineum]
MSDIYGLSLLEILRHEVVVLRSFLSGEFWLQQAAFLGHHLYLRQHHYGLLQSVKLYQDGRPKPTTVNGTEFLRNWNGIGVLLSDIDSSIRFRWGFRYTVMFEKVWVVFDATWEDLETLSSIPGKANVVADALSRKSRMIACFDSIILRDLERLDVELCVRGSGGYWASMRIESNLMQDQEAKGDVDRLCVPNDQALREKVMTEAHSSPFTIHPGSTKMYRDLKQYFWWNGMKQDVWLLCIPMYDLSSQKRHDAIWVVVDRLTKSAHFLPIRKNYGIKIRSLRLVFERLQKAWGNRLSFSTSISPQNRTGQSERTIQTLEDMLRACALEWTGSWDEYLCFGGVCYNNSWHAELIEITNEKVAVAKEKLKEARSRQKSYADKHRRDLEFQVGDRVFLKVSPFRGVKRFGIKGKLSPRFIGPFEILERIGEVSYRLAVHPQLIIQPDMSLSEEPESILDRQERVMRNKVIPFVKILWKNHPEREATWETEESMRASYPHFFV